MTHASAVDHFLAHPLPGENCQCNEAFRLEDVLKNVFMKDMVGQTEAIEGGQVHYCPDMLWMLYPWSVQGQAEQPHLVSGTPAHDRGVGTK